MPFKEHSLALFSGLKLLPIHNLIDYRVGVYAFKHKDTLITFNHEVHSYNTRSSTKGHHSYHRTTKHRNSLKGHLVHVWNNIPDDIGSGYSLPSFQKKLFTHFLSKMSLLN